MLDDVQRGKFEGIIAWHPDRLARNMKDAGEIIDLLDKNIIKDLQFVSFSFENDTAGKMLLGMSFVLSKQYSDKLSDDVRRGVRRRIEEGRYLSKAKHGYYRDRNMMLRPDKENFELLQEAWQMRLEGKIQKTIAEYLNKNNYMRSNGVGKITHKKFEISEQNLSEIFRDPFYAGVLAYGRKKDIVVDLTEVYDFTPMVTVDEFLKINKFSDIKKAFEVKTRSAKGGVKADFLRRIVYCGHCNEPMSTGITTKKNKKYYYFRCDTIGCKIKLSSGKKVNQNARGKVILDFVYQFLEDCKFTDKKIYNHYIKEMKQVREYELKELERRRKSLQQEKSNLEESIVKYKEFIIDEKDNEIRNSYKVDLKAKNKRLKEIVKLLAKIKKAKGKGGEAILTYKEFIELFGKLADILRKTKSINSKDQIIRRIFSNFVLKDKKVAMFSLNPPFDEFANIAEIKNSRDDRTRTCDLTHPMRAL